MKILIIDNKNEVGEVTVETEHYQAGELWTKETGQNKSELLWRIER